LPPLSWAAEIGKENVIVHHGPRLEHGDDWMIDGAWPGRFEAGLPNETVEGFFAFSLRVTGNEVQIECPTHPLERLFLLREDNRIIVSPSVAFICALTGADIDPAYPDYLIDNYRVISRISMNCGSMPLAAGKTLEIIANRRVFISRNLEVRIEYRPLEKSFRDFSEYKDFLTQITAGIRENISSIARRAGTYGFASAISNGYDSPMLNILAAPYGLKNAVTFSAPGDTEDSGEKLGPYIGVNVHPLDRHHYRRTPGNPEADFIASGARGEDVVFSGAESHFKNNAVITGIFAEVADANMIHPSADIRRTNTVGCGFLEFRWRTPFLHTPIAHAGCMGMMSLKVISRSKEMEPWSVGGNYDRPIARRIIEGAGIPRGSFADHKIGVLSVRFDVGDAELAKIMNPESHRSLMQFIDEVNEMRPISLRSKRVAKYAAYRAERFIGHTLKKMGVFDKVPNSFDLAHHSLPGNSSFLYPWAVRLLKNKYAKALKDNATN
jgi:hypothetical protein